MVMRDLISREAANAREVFAGSCSAAKEAIDYLEQLLLATLPPSQEPAPKSCPLCGAEMDIEGEGWEHPASDDCPLDSLFILPHHVEAWNRRALPTDQEAAPAVKVEPPEAGETRTISVLATWKPCVHGGGWWVADDADGVPRILTAPARENLRKELPVGDVI